MDSREGLHHVFELVQAQFVPFDPGDRAKPGAREVASCQKGFGRIRKLGHASAILG